MRHEYKLRNRPLLKVFNDEWGVGKSSSKTDSQARNVVLGGSVTGQATVPDSLTAVTPKAKSDSEAPSLVEIIQLAADPSTTSTSTTSPSRAPSRESTPFPESPIFKGEGSKAETNKEKGKKGKTKRKERKTKKCAAIRNTTDRRFCKQDTRRMYRKLSQRLIEGKFHGEEWEGLTARPSPPKRKLMDDLLPIKRPTYSTSSDSTSDDECEGTDSMHHKSEKPELTWVQIAELSPIPASSDKAPSPEGEVDNDDERPAKRQKTVINLRSNSQTTRLTAEEQVKSTKPDEATTPAQFARLPESGDPNWLLQLDRFYQQHFRLHYRSPFLDDGPDAYTFFQKYATVKKFRNRLPSDDGWGSKSFPGLFWKLPCKIRQEWVQVVATVKQRRRQEYEKEKEQEKKATGAILEKKKLEQLKRRLMRETRGERRAVRRQRREDSDTESETSDTDAYDSPTEDVNNERLELSDLEEPRKWKQRIKKIHEEARAMPPPTHLTSSKALKRLEAEKQLRKIARGKLKAKERILRGQASFSDSSEG